MCNHLSESKCTLMDKKMRRANAKVADAEKYIYNLFYGDHKVYWSEKIEYSVKQLLLII